MLAAIRQGIGSKAGAYLYENKINDKNGKTRYFVGIYTGGPDGKGPEFGTLNVPAAVINALVQTKDVVKFDSVAPLTRVMADSGETALIGTPNDLLPTTPGATFTSGGNLNVTILDPSSQYGFAPPEIMSDRKASALDAGIVSLHEFGHAAYRLGLLIPGPTNRAAVTLENHVRKLRDPSAPTRIKHNRRE